MINTNLILGLAAIFLSGCAPDPCVPHLERVSFADVPGWRRDVLPEALVAQKHSCVALQNKAKDSHWHPFCTAVSALDEEDTHGYWHILETHLVPYRAFVEEPTLFTGYYEPLLRGSRQRSEAYPYPLYGLPNSGINYRLPRDQLGEALLQQQVPVLVWVDCPIDAFFLEIQGSGRIHLDTGEIMRVGYAGQNGYPYFPIGKALVQRQEISAQTVSLQSIKKWLRENPKQAQGVMDLNQSYVFFRELTGEGPLGAQGVPLTPQRSIAIDPRFIPLGAPLWVDVAHPLQKDISLQQLMIAQDTGGAIKGLVRADIFWGFGPEAEAAAGQMKHKGCLFVLLPERE
jgi:membrane-bound lytic murein transglycosylase A